MDRLDRKTLKQDAFVEQTRGFVDKFEDNPTPFILAVVALLAVVFGGLGIWALMGSRVEAQAERFSRAQAAYLGNIVTDEEPNPADEYDPTFATASARAEEAANRFAEVGGGGAGKMAALLQGTALLEAGKAEEAIEALDEASRKLSGDPTWGGPARAAYATALAEGGRVEESVATWRELADDTNAGYPADLALAGLARTLENAGQLEEAQVEWRKILDLYPDSPVAAEARRAADVS